VNIGNEILQMLQDEISEIEYNRYIKQLSFDSNSTKNDTAFFIAPNVIVANYIQTKYQEKLAHLFEIKTGQKYSIEIVTASKQSSKKPAAAVQNSSNTIAPSLLNPAYTFENFVVGSSNQFAFVATKNVSEKPAQLYNPLFLYGGVGLGKTHLMQAAGNIMLEAGKSVIYTSVEQFLNDFTRHMRNQTMERFKEKYRQCDMLLIDDVQFLSGKHQTQEEFFHTFEALRNDNKQIIITADKHPKQIAGLEERLKSRFEWGLVTDIQPPELETKIAIIKKKCDINRVQLESEVINYIATIIDNNAREIEGILSKLHAYSQLMHQNITLEFAKNVLKEQLLEKRSHISIENIMQIISKELNVKPSEIRSKSRSRNIVNARRIAIFLARELTSNSMPKLAQYFGMKDHTAISHTMKKIQTLRKEDESFRLKIEELNNKITASVDEQ